MDREKIILKDVTKAYALEGAVHTVFEGLDLAIDPGEVTVITGRSGCGKTTLLRLLGGLEMPTSGSISIPAGLTTGMVFQEPRLMPWLSCEQNITLGMKNPDRKETEDIIELVGLTGFEKALPHQLSGGMQQRAALARALIRKCDLLLMDEPFAALDEELRGSMQQEFLSIIRESGSGAVFVTHDMNEARILADRIIDMNSVLNDMRKKVEG